MKAPIELGKHDLSLGDYCGPSAVQLLTGLDRYIVRERFNAIRGRRVTYAVMGTSMKEMLLMFKGLGFPFPMVVDFGKQKKIADLPKSIIAVVETGNHWLAYHKGEIADNHDWQWREASESIYARKRAKRVLILEMEGTR